MGPDARGGRVEGGPGQNDDVLQRLQPTEHHREGHDVLLPQMELCDVVEVEEMGLK